MLNEGPKGERREIKGERDDQGGLRKGGAYFGDEVRKKGKRRNKW